MMNTDPPKRQVRTEIWAHRGAADELIENTIPAFSLAVEQGADGIELDVHLAKDRTLVVTHDEDFSRLGIGAGTKKIADMTWSEIAEINLALPNQSVWGKVPRLEEVFQLLQSEKFRDKKIKLNIELKTDENEYLGIEEAVLELSKSFGYSQDLLIFSSFNGKTLKRLQSLDSSLHLGFLFKNNYSKVKKIQREVHLYALHPHYSLLYFCMPFKASHYNACVHSWTVDKVSTMKLCFKKEIAAIITNKPKLALDIRKNYLV